MTRTIFDLCEPRADVLSNSLTESDFAADLAQVIRKQGPEDYWKADLFFANTYPTRGLKNLLANVCGRLSGKGGSVAAIFRLDTSYGGGKTHGLIALSHAANGMKRVATVSEFLDPALVPTGEVRIAAFDGENADPANGRMMGDGIKAFTPWGEIAYALAGKAGYERVRSSDEKRIAPGAETLRELFGGKPTLILLDELSVYLRKVKTLSDSRDQLTAFLTSLFKAVEGAPNAALVYTLAIGKEGRATDAYSEENEFIASKMAEAESVSARKATLLNPTEDDETVKVLLRRLFQKIDNAGAEEVITAYSERWNANRDALTPEATRPETVDIFRESYPLHPEVLDTLTSKTATLVYFQRVRGMLRLLARTISHLWADRPADATAIHLHHIDPGYEPIRQEIVTRLGQTAYVPAIRNDITGGVGEKKALAQEIDEAQYRGLPPYATYVARTIFIHSLAFNDPLKGLHPDRLKFSVLGPSTDITFIEDARKRFIMDSAYLDDRPHVPMKFHVEANLTQTIRRQEQHVDPGDAKSQLNDRIRQIFGGNVLEMVPFPGGPFDLPDEVGDGRPKMAVIAYDAVSIGTSVDKVPDLIEKIFTRKGSDGTGYRNLRNHVVFVVADEDRKSEMKRKVSRRLALGELKKPERLAELADHQQAKLRELEARSEQELAIAIQQCYRHVFYPSRARMPGCDIDLAHTAIDVHSTSDKPGDGQKQVVRALRDLNQLRLSEDSPDSPTFVRDKTPLKKGSISTGALREEFRKDPGLPMLVGNDVFLKGIRNGVEIGEYVYQRKDLLFGPGDPPASIQIDEESFVHTMAYAKEKGIWPRPAPKPPEPFKPVVPIQPGLGFGGGIIPDVITSSSKSFSADGVLKEALTHLWEQARAAKVEKIDVLTLRVFEWGDAFRLLSAMGGVSGTGKSVVFSGGYETKEGTEFRMEFKGSSGDAQPVKEFLDAQFRAASTRDLQADYSLAFESGLSMKGDAPETLTDRLSKFASGAVQVKAVAEVKK